MNWFSFRPLNIVQVNGSFCCRNFYQSSLANHFLSNTNCLQAKSIEDSNALIIWGSISKHLAVHLQKQITKMPKAHVVIHLRGCQRRIENQLCTSSLQNFFAVNLIHSNCTIEPKEIAYLKNEAIKCLRV